MTDSQTELERELSIAEDEKMAWMMFRELNPDAPDVENAEEDEAPPPPPAPEEMLEPPPPPAKLGVLLDENGDPIGSADSAPPSPPPPPGESVLVIESAPVSGALNAKSSHAKKSNEPDDKHLQEAPVPAEVVEEGNTKEVGRECESDPDDAKNAVGEVDEISQSSANSQLEYDTPSTLDEPEAKALIVEEEPNKPQQHASEHDRIWESTVSKKLYGGASKGTTICAEAAVFFLHGKKVNEDAIDKILQMGCINHPRRGSVVCLELLTHGSSVNRYNQHLQYVAQHDGSIEDLTVLFELFRKYTETAKDTPMCGILECRALGVVTIFFCPAGVYFFDPEERSEARFRRKERGAAVMLFRSLDAFREYMSDILVFVVNDDKLEEYDLNYFTLDMLRLNPNAKDVGVKPEKKASTFTSQDIVAFRRKKTGSADDAPSRPHKRQLSRLTFLSPEEEAISEEPSTASTTDIEASSATERVNAQREQAATLPVRRSSISSSGQAKRFSFAPGVTVLPPSAPSDGRRSSFDHNQLSAMQDALAALRAQHDDVYSESEEDALILRQILRRPMPKAESAKLERLYNRVFRHHMDEDGQVPMSAVQKLLASMGYPPELVIAAVRLTERPDTIKFQQFRTVMQRMKACKALMKQTSPQDNKAVPKTLERAVNK